MKVQAIIGERKRNMTIRDDVAAQKKLRRLPHIFEKVLQLPFHSNAHVLVQETPSSLRFVVAADISSADICAKTIEVCPGVSKIVVRRSTLPDDLLDLELDVWRFRLPPATRPDLASAAVVAGELVVTVPKEEEDKI